MFIYLSIIYLLSVYLVISPDHVPVSAKIGRRRMRGLSDKFMRYDTSCLENSFQIWLQQSWNIKTHALRHPLGSPSKGLSWYGWILGIFSHPRIGFNRSCHLWWFIAVQLFKDHSMVVACGVPLRQCNFQGGPGWSREWVGLKTLFYQPT